MRNRIKMLAEKNKFKLAVGIIIPIVLLGIVGPFFVVDPDEYVGPRYKKPCWKYMLGTNSFGNDVWSQLLHGIRNSLLVGSIAALIALCIAFSVGGIGGYKGGIFDEGLNLMSNIFITIPMIPLLIVLATLIEQRSLYIVALVIAAIYWPGSARSIRSQVFSLKERNFVNLARMSGKGDIKIIFYEIFPNMLAYIFIQFVVIFAGAVVAETGISLIGLGPTDVVTLGTMLHWALINQAIHLGVWWTFLPPGIILVLFTGSLILMGSVIDDVLNPRLRGVL